MVDYPPLPAVPYYGQANGESNTVWTVLITISLVILFIVIIYFLWQAVKQNAQVQLLFRNH
jgi:hypothetical protein